MTPLFHTLATDERGQQALGLLPAPSQPGDEVLVFGKNLREMDAWTGTAFRTAIEYHCVNFGNTITLEAPAGPGQKRAFGRLCELLGPLPPAFHLSDQRSAPGTGPGLAILPALRIEDWTDAENAATTIHFRASGYGVLVSRTVAAAAAVFIDIALTHAATSSVGVVTSIACDPLANTVQVVSSDLGREIVEPEEAERFLLGVRQHATAAHSNLAHVVQAGGQRGLSLVLTLAVGPGRLRWSRDSVTSETTFTTPGFTQALTISLVR